MIEQIKVGDLVIVLDDNQLLFNETNLNEFIKKEHGVYSYFGKQLADVEHLQWLAQQDYEAAYSKLFADIKENQGGSDKLVEAKCKSDLDVLEKEKKFFDFKCSAAKIKAFLRGLDKAHDNAQSLGHNLRKEMDKLGADIHFSSDPGLEDKLEQIMNGAE